MDDNLLEYAHRSIRNQQYYQTHQWERKREIYHRRELLLNKLWNIKIKRKCSKCSSQCSKINVKDYHFHHFNPKTKLFEISDAVCRGFSWERIEKELKKCEFVCAKCHLGM